MALDEDMHNVYAMLLCFKITALLAAANSRIALLDDSGLSSEWPQRCWTSVLWTGWLTIEKKNSTKTRLNALLRKTSVIRGHSTSLRNYTTLYENNRVHFHKSEAWLEQILLRQWNDSSITEHRYRRVTACKFYLITNWPVVSYELRAAILWCVKSIKITSKW